MTATNTISLAPAPHRGLPRHAAVALQAALAIVVSVVVWNHAWVSEDSFITFRHVANTLHGHGAVFNPGDSVQGYTHPLWFLVLLLGTALHGDPITTAVVIGVVFTGLTFILAARSFVALTGSPWQGTALASLFALLCLSSDSWTAFQTGGLENALSHLLIVLFVAESCRPEDRGVGRLGVLAAALVLNRPDLVLLVAPVIAASVWRRRLHRRQLASLVLGLSPVPVWLLFAWWYYGDLVPNTARVKLGMYASWRDSFAQGLLYASDWARHEPLAVLGLLALTVVGVITTRRHLLSSACGIGIVVMTLYVVCIGGGFMRGRLFLASFVAGTFYGLAAAAGGVRRQRRATAWLAGALPVATGGWLVLSLLLPAPTGRISGAGIVDERRFYPGYHFAAYRRDGRLLNPYLDLTLAEHLRAYATTCGAVTVHSRSPGTLGYLAGPGVTVIDTLGLTDRFIARLPPTSLYSPHPRPGHPDKYIPLDYLASRRDISLLPAWRASVKSRDCALPDHAAHLEGTGHEIAFPDGWGPPVIRQPQASR